MAKKWYIIQTYAGQENSIKDAIERRIKTMNFEDRIYQVMSPEEKYIETKKDGTQVEKTRKIHPGYLYVQIEVNGEFVDDESWFMIRNTPGVTGFLGSSGKGTKPNHVPQYEMDALLRKVGLLQKPKFDFEVGDEVQIINGSFAGFRGTVSQVNEATQIVTVDIEMFGRLTPSEEEASNLKHI